MAGCVGQYAASTDGSVLNMRINKIGDSKLTFKLAGHIGSVLDMRLNYLGVSLHVAGRMCDRKCWPMCGWSWQQCPR